MTELVPNKRRKRWQSFWFLLSWVVEWTAWFGIVFFIIYIMQKYWTTFTIDELHQFRDAVMTSDSGMRLLSSMNILILAYLALPLLLLLFLASVFGFKLTIRREKPSLWRIFMGLSGR